MLASEGDTNENVNYFCAVCQKCGPDAADAGVPGAGDPPPARPRVEAAAGETWAAAPIS